MRFARKLSCLKLFALAAGIHTFPIGLCLADATPTADQRFKVVTPEQPWLHHWRLTAGFDYSEGLDLDRRSARSGDNRSYAAGLGLEAGIGRYGFGRINLGRRWDDNSSTEPFLEDDGESRGTSVGFRGGMFVLPFLAVGGMVQYEWAHAHDTFSDPDFGVQLTELDRDDRTLKWAPFVTAVYPIGRIELSATGSYLNVERHSDYSGIGATIDHDSGNVHAWTVGGDAGWWVLHDLQIGGGVTWIEIANQTPQFGATPLDDSWGVAQGHLLWRTPLPNVELEIRGSHDFDNRQGNGWSIGSSLGFRF